jgi:hypothetical protein
MTATVGRSSAVADWEAKNRRSAIVIWNLDNMEAFYTGKH